MPREELRKRNAARDATGLSITKQILKDFVLKNLLCNLAVKPEELKTWPLVDDISGVPCRASGENLRASFVFGWSPCKIK